MKKLMILVCDWCEVMLNDGRDGHMYVIVYDKKGEVLTGDYVLTFGIHVRNTVEKRRIEFYGCQGIVENTRRQNTRLTSYRIEEAGRAGATSLSPVWRRRPVLTLTA